MDDVHGFGPDPQVEKFKEDLAAHIWFRDGGVHREGAEYDHLKRFAHTQCSCAQGEAHDWRIAESSRDQSVQTVCWRFALLHTRQSRCTVRGVNSGIDVGKTDSRIDDCSETRDTLIEGNETLCQQT